MSTPVHKGSAGATAFYGNGPQSTETQDQPQTRQAHRAARGRRVLKAPQSMNDQTAATAKEAAEQPHTKRVAPRDVDIPHQGWAGLKYFFYRVIGHPDRVPKLGKKEALRYERQHDEDRLRFLTSHPEMQITVCFVNVKGGASKTTTALYVGSIISHLTGRSIWVLPATQATATSTTALNAGIAPEDTLTVSEFAQMHRELGSYRAASAKVPLTPAKLRVLSEDTARDVAPSTGFGLEEFCHVTDTLHDNVDGMLFDTGNDDVVEGSVVLEAVRRADVVVFTATADKPTTLAKLNASISIYLTDLITKRNVTNNWDGVRIEDQITTREKVCNAIAVISGVDPKENASHYRHYTQKYDEKTGQITGSIGFEGTVRTIPRDPHIANIRDIVVDIFKLKDATYRAYLKLAIEIYERAAKLRGVDLYQSQRKSITPDASQHSPS